MKSKIYAPLKGVRILSFELAFALPAGTRALHDLGADVVRVTPPGGNNFGRYVSVSDGVFHGKPCISIDLTKVEGRKLSMDLAMKADVVCNNFRPSVLAKYGLSSNILREKKAELITLQLSGYGTPGPWSNFPAYGPSTEAAGGFNRLMVNEGEVPVRIGTGVFSDQLAGRHAALAIVAALQKRSKTGKGQHIDLSMTECITQLMGELITEASITGSVPVSHGNRNPKRVPQGIYPCLGEDEWIAISIEDDKAWQRFVPVSGIEQLRAEAFREHASRWQRHDDIDELLSAWTIEFKKDDLTRLLQDQDIAAAPVRTVVDSALDPQFKARGALQMVDHAQPLFGYSAHPHPPLPWLVEGRE
jgi:crotonobetainyl-CoA:carnitine CoA-transferase CaiB-like acyl-CoA transferase